MNFRKPITALLVAGMLACHALAADAALPLDHAQLDQRIQQLIEQLGAPEYTVRRRAHDMLLEHGFDAFDLLSEAQYSDDPEIAMQASYLVRAIRVDWTGTDAPRAVQDIFAEYDAQSEERRLLRVKKLIDLPDDQGLEWLCRVVRFEVSPLVSKQAALAMVDNRRARDDTAWQRRAALISRHMQRSRRTAASWLLTYLQMRDHPEQALAEWSRHIADERAALEQHPQETSSRIVVSMLLEKIALLDRLDRVSEVDDAMRAMVQCERGDAESLVRLVEWLARRRAWHIVDEVAARFAATFDLDAMLLYVLCEARRAQGDQELAEEIAAKALKLGGDNPLDHFAMARKLLDRGLTEWSDREFAHVIVLGPISSPASIQSRLLLSDSLHDRQREAEAAGHIKELVDAIDADPNVRQQVKLLLQQTERSVDFLRARLYYYQACAARRNGDRTLQRTLLDKAIEEEPADLDVIIALYRLPDDDPRRRQKIVQLIENLVRECRGKIEEDPGDPVYYNELAWLVANTEGDFDEALRLSHTSVDMVRAEAGSEADFKRLGQYLDTLAHCYFAKQDHANAVKYQTEAASLDPHTRAIARQLEVFKAALAEQQASAPVAQDP